MKVCAVCGDEIDTRDGENVCMACDTASEGKRNQVSLDRQNTPAVRKAQREKILKDLGLVKVKGAMGGIYFE